MHEAPVTDESSVLEGTQQSGKSNILAMLQAQIQHIDEDVAEGLLTEEEARRIREGRQVYQRN